MDLSWNPGLVVHRSRVCYHRTRLGAALCRRWHRAQDRGARPINGLPGLVVEPPEERLAHATALLARLGALHQALTAPDRPTRVGDFLARQAEVMAQARAFVEREERLP